MLKRDFIRRLNLGITISFSVFAIFLGVYFYTSFFTEVSAIQTSLNIAQEAITDTTLITSIKNNLSEAAFLYSAQLITFLIALFSLLTAFWYTTQRYLVEKRNSLIDPLTNIYNRKAVFFALKRELQKSERFGHPTSIAIIDIDYFKKYNDSNGHVAGDNVLKRFGKIMADSVRKYDVYGRYGGEEFIIVFPETNIKEASKICERVRSKMESSRFYGQHKMPFKKVTISVGIAELKGKKKMKKETLIHKADERLYSAKETGRNQVIYK